MVTVTRFAEGLCTLEERDFTVARVARYVAENPVAADSLTPYIRYEATHIAAFRCRLAAALSIESRARRGKRQALPTSAPHGNPLQS